MNQEGNPRIRVECYAGYRGEETPIRFFLAERKINIDNVVDRWLDPNYRYFKVRGDDGGIYILRHDTKSGIWKMTLFNSGNKPDTCLSST